MSVGTDESGDGGGVQKVQLGDFRVSGLVLLNGEEDDTAIRETKEEKEKGTFPIPPVVGRSIGPD